MAITKPLVELPHFRIVAADEEIEFITNETFTRAEIEIWPAANPSPTAAPEMFWIEFCV